MANYMTTDIELTAIANAIRNKVSGGGHSGYHDYVMGLNNIISVDNPDAVIHVIYPEGAICTCTDGTTIITAPNTSGEVNFGVEIGTWTVSASNNGEARNKEIIVEQRREIKEVEISILLPPIGTILNNWSWEQISDISQDGTGDTYFDIGDCKAVRINGTIGTLALNTTLYVFILDFNHPIDKTTADNNIIWGGFKTALTNGKDVALCDASYNSDKSDGTKIFNINHKGDSSPPFSTNYGGWKGCDFRFDILGGTSTTPSLYNTTKTTSNTGYDATQATIDTPIANTLMAALPSDLRAVLRLWNRYVDYKGNSSNTNANCSTATVDAISLLADFEIFGSRKYANKYEQNHQKQMAYYSTGNSKIKYRHNATSTACRWWMASAYYDNAYSFCRVDTDGSTNIGAPHTSHGLAPAFKT